MDNEKKKRLAELRDSMKSYGYMDGVEELEDIFPEIKENEDEGIRKFIIDCIDELRKANAENADFNGCCSEAIAYLEEHKEPTWTAEDESFVKHILPRILNPDKWTLDQISADKRQLTAFIERQKRKYAKEQQPAEWNEEDEWIRKHIIKILENLAPCHWDGNEKARCIAYLERQKEREDKLYEKTKDRFYKEGVDDGILIGKERQKEQESLNISAASEWLRKHISRYMNSEYNEFHKCVEYDGSIDKDKLINDFEEAMQKEQKPIKVYDNMDDLIADAMIDEISKSDMSDSAKHNRIYWINKHRQNLAEWSEEDEKMLASFLHKAEVCDLLTNKENAWIVKRLKSLRPQPKQVWSDEDEKFINDLCNLMASLAKNNRIGCYYAPDIISKIKNLRARAITYALDAPLGYDNDKNPIYPPINHWKPSEEQMGALEHFIRSWGESGTMSPQNPILCAAESLYNELKKL